MILSFASETYFRFESFDIDVCVSDGIVPYVVIFLQREREREKEAMLKGRGVKNVCTGGF